MAGFAPEPGPAEASNRKWHAYPDGKINQEMANSLGWQLGPKTNAEWMEMMGHQEPQVEQAPGLRQLP